MPRHNLKPLSQIIKDLANHGYDSQFTVKDHWLYSFNSKKSYAPQQVRLEEEYRFEGNTNPSDQSILYQIRCETGEKGIIVANYGAHANQEVHEFVQEVQNTFKHLYQS